LKHEADQLEDLDVQDNTELKQNSKKQDRNIWEGLIWLKTATRGVPL